ncbi:hypothetical protein AVEN_232457-1 [Araneus ventricosus]|uniref:Uncharacterized protein n=1 Tax=Araneus ventricosus TaxID=182803 RepID=A0A4Y2EBC3_ARAVE|nr:hypothetical protein AVEN_232457-1 [Araneus ventricosus]
MQDYLGTVLKNLVNFKRGQMIRTTPELVPPLPAGVRFTLYGCILTVSWHMRKPVPNFEQECLKRAANYLVSRHKIRRIDKFISENRDLFLPP